MESAAKYSGLAVMAAIVGLATLPKPVAAFGAGNISSLSKIEGKNWRHGDIEDTLKEINSVKGKKFKNNDVKRVYFGNWMRDYSQAIDVGTLKSVPAETIRVLVWVLGSLNFGYSTEEFEVTAIRLGVYRPEEHIDNPKGYADGEDASKLDARLRPPIDPRELEIDTRTGMKNYIANEDGDWATSTAYIRASLRSAIHFGRLYTASGSSGNKPDYYEALRFLGQSLHTLEDFGAHTNYTELALRELGFNNVFTHTGRNTQMNIQGRQVYPLVTGTFGGVDFFHSVLGEASDHVTQSEIDNLDESLGNTLAGDSSPLSGLTSVLGKIPGTRDLCDEAAQLDSQSQQAKQAYRRSRANQSSNFSQSRGIESDPWGGRGSGSNWGDRDRADTSMVAAEPKPQDINIQETVKKIYPVLVFRDKVVRTISAIVSKIPGLESLIETVTEHVTIFIMSVLAPYLKPLIEVASKQLKTGSSAVISSSQQQQYEPWTDSNCTDPTHSLLSKDHFSNILNEPAGRVAATIVSYTVPRVVYAWEHPGVDVEQVLDDILQAFHHPALRTNSEIHKSMFGAVQQWANEKSNSRKRQIEDCLNSEAVKAGRNHVGGVNPHPH